jgi:hypothetical protein
VRALRRRASVLRLLHGCRVPPGLRGEAAGPRGRASPDERAAATPRMPRPYGVARRSRRPTRCGRGAARDEEVRWASPEASARAQAGSCRTRLPRSRWRRVCCMKCVPAYKGCVARRACACDSTDAASLQGCAAKPPAHEVWPRRGAGRRSAPGECHAERRRASEGVRAPPEPARRRRSRAGFAGGERRGRRPDAGERGSRGVGAASPTIK